MKLYKNGLVRETRSQQEAQRLLALDYKEMTASLDMDEGKARQIMLENLLGLKAEELRTLCEERGLSLPSAAKKQELAEAIADHDLTEEELPENEGE